jgi:hypothetical protein
MKSKSIVRMRKRIPLFPVLPLVPLGLFIANAVAIFRLFRKVNRLEAHEVLVVA